MTNEQEAKLSGCLLLLFGLGVLIAGIFIGANGETGGVLVGVGVAALFFGALIGGSANPGIHH